MKRLACLATVAAAGLVAAPALGKPNPYTPDEVCGAGFLIIDHYPLVYFTEKQKQKRAGTIYLLFKPGTGRHCVVTLKKAAAGKKTRVGAWVGPRNTYPPRRKQVGRFEYYAGPVYQKAVQGCVDWGGVIDLPGRKGVPTTIAGTDCPEG